MSVETCCQCHGACVVAGSADAIARPDLPVLARGADGAPVCDRCVAVRTRWRLTDGRPAVGYLNADLTAVTSWGGTEIARIVRSSTFRSNLTGTKVTSWSAVLPNGRKVYGRGAGAGMSTTARPYKVGA